MSITNNLEYFDRRYLIKEKLGKGGMGVVYRAYDRLAKQEVALKKVTAPTDKLEFSMRDSLTEGNLQLALAREFKILASLRHPHIISVLDYGFDQELQPYVTMQLLENAPTILAYGEDQPAEVQIDLLIQLLQALSYLHRHSILHRDLKPGNVLVVGGQVKVLDFGLATAQGQVTDSAVVGTLAYVAPEIVQEEAPTPSTDLYAIGVMAHELFLGDTPFDPNDIQNFFVNLLYTEPNLSGLDEIQLVSHSDGAVNTENENSPSTLRDVVSKLLTKEPANRYQKASDVIRGLNQLLGKSTSAETSEIRESFLQAAKFVGRTKEKDKLITIMREAVMGKGSVCLVGGESGVGKSRLMDELRTYALVEGLDVVRGQAVSEGGAPYQAWHEIFRWLVVQSDLSDDEAAILKLFVSDVDELHDREIPEPPPLDSQQVPVRLFHTIRDILKRREKPLMLMLEDLQWAGAESIDILKRINSLISEMNVIVISNYRNDEKPDLPDSLPQAHEMQLNRLDEQAISELSTSMLGDVGQRPELIKLLEKETEGNAFFVVEVVRVLAEQAGQLDEIATLQLPETVFAGGIQEIVQRRIDRVVDAGQTLLKRAAIAGRQLDPTLLEYLRKQYNQNSADDTDNLKSLDIWLNECADAKVIEIFDGRWRFTHDKLREYLLAQLEEDEKINLHQEVAKSIEQLYPDDADHAASLAYLWQVAENSIKEIHYLKLAGNNAVRRGANSEAATFFSKALEVLLQQPESPERDLQELELQIALGAPLVVTKGMPSPVTGAVYIRSYELVQKIGETPLIVPTLFGLTQYNIGQNKLDRAQELADQVLGLARQIQDPNLMIAAMWIAGICYYQQGKLSESRALYEEGMSLYDPKEHQTHLAHYGQDFGVSSRIWSARPVWLMGQADLAEERINDGLNLAKEFNHPFTLLLAHLIVGFVRQYRLEVTLTKENAAATIALAREYEVPQMLGAAQVLHGWARAQQGDTATGIEEIIEGIATWEETGGKVELSYYHTLLAETYASNSAYSDAQETLEYAMKLVQESGEYFWEPEILRVRGDIQLNRSGDLEEASKNYREAIASAQRTGTKALELRASIKLAQCMKSQSRNDDAHKMLKTIYELFNEGFSTKDLQAAKSLLDTLQVSK